MMHLPIDPARPYKILCLGAHSDDIEIGCGGTLLKLTRAYPNLVVHWVVFSANEQRAVEARHSADCFLHDAQATEVVIETFRDGFFPFHGSEIKEYFEQLKPVEPDLILTHSRADAHQDHRLLADLTWNTFRRHLILEYEIPKYDGDLGTPNLFIALDEPTCQTKVDYLLRHFQTQGNKHWFTADTFLALLRLRGIEANAPASYAEAFFCRKMTF